AVKRVMRNLRCSIEEKLTARDDPLAQVGALPGDAVELDLRAAREAVLRRTIRLRGIVKIAQFLVYLPVLVVPGRVAGADLRLRRIHWRRELRWPSRNERLQPSRRRTKCRTSVTRPAPRHAPVPRRCTRSTVRMFAMVGRLSPVARKRTPRPMMT